MNNQRICTICKIIKPFIEFHWDKRFDIPFSRCKICYNQKCKSYRSSKEGKDNYKKWFDNGGKISRYRNLKNHHSKHKNRYMARYTLTNAIRDKRLMRKPCEVCQDPKSEGHHTSYEKENWLNVTWLCKKHHVEETYSSFI